MESHTRVSESDSRTPRQRLDSLRLGTDLKTSVERGLEKDRVRIVTVNMLTYYSVVNKGIKYLILKGQVLVCIEINIKRMYKNSS